MAGSLLLGSVSRRQKRPLLTKVERLGFEKLVLPLIVMPVATLAQPKAVSTTQKVLAVSGLAGGYLISPDRFICSGQMVGVVGYKRGRLMTKKEDNTVGYFLRGGRVTIFKKKFENNRWVADDMSLKNGASIHKKTAHNLLPADKT